MPLAEAANFLGPDPDYSHTGARVSKPEKSPSAATAPGTRALPGNNAPAMHYEGSPVCSVKGAGRIPGGHAKPPEDSGSMLAWARGCNAKPVRPSGLPVFLAKELESRERTQGSTRRAQGRVGLPWKEAAVWVVSREAMPQVVASVCF